MTPVYRSEQIRLIDREAVERHHVPSLVLMENAARGACDAIIESGVELAGSQIVIVCGRGNNGGDGLALARHCVIHGAHVECVLLDDPSKLSADAAAQLAMLETLAPGSVFRWQDAREPLAADVLVDAMLGTGATGAPRGDYAAAVEWLNDCEGMRLALDIPTGLDANSGAAAAPTFAADVTVTMAALKPGLLLGEGAALSGTVYIVHIGVPESAYPEADCWLLDEAIAAATLPAIEAGRNKYDRGKVLVVAGARGMTGAGVMAAGAAARTGAGLTVLALPEAASPLPHALPPEVMTRWLASGEDGAFAADAVEALRAELTSFGVIALGPGLSKSTTAASFAAAMLAASSSPVVLDADGLAGFAGNIERLRERAGELVITPHHGEMARLLGVTSAAVAADPLGVARDAARRSGAIVVLKGAPTVVALEDGRAWINSAGNPGMATGGSGDVLTGMIASLVAQSHEAAAATLAAVYLHSHAADLAAEETTERALMATDITDRIVDAYRSLREESI